MEGVLKHLNDAGSATICGAIFILGIAALILIGDIFLSYNWWKDCPPNNGKEDKDED
jgi:hypothetical protein